LLLALLLLLRLRLLLVRRAGREDRLIFVSCARPQVRAPAVAGHIFESAVCGACMPIAVARLRDPPFTPAI